MKQLLTVTVATSNKLFKDSISYFLKKNGYVVLASCESLSKLKEDLKDKEPDLVILGPSTASSEPVDLLKYIRTSQLRTKTIIYNYSIESFHEAIYWGVNGYLIVKDGLAELVECIKHVELEERYISTSTMTKLSQNSSGNQDVLSKLSSRERKILRLIADGWGSKQIAEKLFVSPHTVKNHKTNIIRKLSINSSKELLPFALSIKGDYNKKW